MKYQKYIDKLNVSLEGKTYIVTGANSGIGFYLSKYLMYLGATVIFACRSEQRAQKAIEDIRKEVNSGNAIFIPYDQANLQSINDFASKIKENYKIDGLICNAGIYYPKAGSKTADGFEMTIGTNFIGQFALVDNLYDLLKDNEDARLVIVTSLTAIQSKYFDLDKNIELGRNKIYAYSKLLLAKEAYELTKLDDKLCITLTHPGVASTNILFNKDTGLANWFAKAGRRFLNLFTHSAAKAALTTLVGVVCKKDKYLYIKPRGPFRISGYPTIKKMPKKFVSEGLIDKTRDIISKKGELHVIGK